MNKEEIKKIIPYDDPFLFVDEVTEIEENKILGYKYTGPKDYYFAGHFIDFPIMPGVLVLEAMAQLSTILLRKKIGKSHKDYHFLAYDLRSGQFYKPIFPGDKIKLEAEILAIYPLNDGENKIARVKSKAFVGEELKCEARFSVAIFNKKEFEQKYVRK